MSPHGVAFSHLPPTRPAWKEVIALQLIFHLKCDSRMGLSCSWETHALSVWRARQPTHQKRQNPNARASFQHMMWAFRPIDKVVGPGQQESGDIYHPSEGKRHTYRFCSFHRRRPEKIRPVRPSLHTPDSLLTQQLSLPPTSPLHYAYCMVMPPSIAYTCPVM